MATLFYLDRDGTVGREREGFPTEIYGERSGTWRTYPLDTIHDARQVSPEEALAAMPKGTKREVLEAA